MKMLKKDLESLSKALDKLARKVENLQRQIGEEITPKKRPKTAPVRKKAVGKFSPRKAASKKALPKKAPSTKVKPATAADTLFAIVKRYKKGVGTAALMERTGYNRKKVANLIFKLKKEGKIRSVAKGVYLKV